MRYDKEFLYVKLISLCLLISTIISLGCNTEDSSNKDYASYVSEIKEWHKQRIELLKKEDGVLSVTGLYWLKEGENSFGSNPANNIVLPEEISPELIGTLILDSGIVSIKVEPGIGVTHEGEVINEMVLKSDIEDEMTLLKLGRLSWFIIERNEGFGVRLRDSKNRSILDFRGIEMFKIDPAWRFDAFFESYETPRTVKTVTEYGAERIYESPGALVFSMNEDTFRLDPIPLSDTGRYLLVFGDKTNREETYGGGRFLYVERPGKDNTTILDFNKSINPPCAFSEFFVCPIPPPQNRLPFKVTAGEKKYKGLLH